MYASCLHHGCALRPCNVLISNKPLQRPGRLQQQCPPAVFMQVMHAKMEPPFIAKLHGTSMAFVHQNTWPR